MHTHARPRPPPRAHAHMCLRSVRCPPVLHSLGNCRLEILESDHTDSIHVGSVNSKCEIYDLEAYESLPALG